MPVPMYKLEMTEEQIDAFKNEFIAMSALASRIPIQYLRGVALDNLDVDDVLADTVDTLENLLGALELPLSPALRVKAIKESLPRLVDKLKAMYEQRTGENPWSDDE